MFVDFPHLRGLRIVAAFLLFYFLGQCAITGGAWEAARPALLRLHIVAASDAPEEQAAKLAVRDAVLAVYGDLFAQAQSQAEAQQQAEALLPQIETTAQTALRYTGSAVSTVSAKVTEQFFPTRRYDNTILPAGTYQALQITLGDGGGQNWWCVLYPPLCLSAATSDLSTFPETATPSSHQTLPAEQPQAFQPKLLIVEAVEQLLHRLQSL